MRFASLHFSSACVVSNASEELSSTSRISTASGDSNFHLVGEMGLLLHWSAQGKEKNGSAPALGFGPDSSPVPMNDSLHGRQSDTCSFELVLAMQALKDAEQLV